AGQLAGGVGRRAPVPEQEDGRHRYATSASSYASATIRRVSMPLLRSPTYGLTESVPMPAAAYCLIRSLIWILLPISEVRSMNSCGTASAASALRPAR